MKTIQRPNRSRIIRNLEGVRDPLELKDTFDCFKVVSVSRQGAFLDWGFDEHLFVPADQQHTRMEQGEFYVVYISGELTAGRMTGTSFVDRWLYEECTPDIQPGDEVDLLVCARTDLGFKAIVNNTCLGLLYKNEVFRALSYGERLKGFLRQIRPDGKADLALARQGYDDVGGLAGRIMAHLQSSGGSSQLNDKTPAEEIYRLFSVSKNKFKMALGHLYKRRLVVIENNGVRLVSQGNSGRKSPGGRA